MRGLGFKGLGFREAERGIRGRKGLGFRVVGIRAQGPKGYLL